MEIDKNILLSKTQGPTSELLDCADYRIGYFYLKNSSSESVNEDVLFFKFDKKGDFIFGVADGAGGHPRGEDAALVIGQELLSNKTLPPLDLIESINTKVIELKAGAKSTLAYCSIENDMFRSHSVGDSEVIYWNAQSNILFSNIPHSMVGYGIEAGLINQEESLDNPERHYVASLLGDEIFRVDSSSRISIKKGHTILVGTDGLFDNLSHEVLNDIVSKGIFDKGFEELANLCTHPNENWKKDDDIAFIMVRKIRSN